jgi:outer membrane protein TolC
VLPVEQKAKDFPEYLVQLGWLNNPANGVLAIKKETAENEVKLVKKSWLNGIGVSGGYSVQPIVLTKPIYNAQGVFIGSELNSFRSDLSPSGNAGLNVNLGYLFTNKQKVKIAETHVKIAEAEVNQQKLAVRAEVLKRYQNFRLALEILKTRTQVEQDAKNNFDFMSQQFRSDAVKFTEYNEAASSYHESVEARIKSEAEYQISRIILEEIIGSKWDEVTHPGKDK